MSAEEKIKATIIERGLKQSYVAVNAGIADHKLSRSLNGYRRLRPEEFVRLCQVLGLQMEDFRIDVA